MAKGAKRRSNEQRTVAALRRAGVVVRGKKMDPSNADPLPRIALERLGALFAYFEKRPRAFERAQNRIAVEFKALENVLGYKPSGLLAGPLLAREAETDAAERDRALPKSRKLKGVMGRHQVELYCRRMGALKRYFEGLGGERAMSAAVKRCDAKAVKAVEEAFVDMGHGITDFATLGYLESVAVADAKRRQRKLGRGAKAAKPSAGAA